VAAFCKIRERDLVGREGLFIAEGKVVLDVLLTAGRFPVESILVLENRLAGLTATLNRAPAGLPVYAATAAVMDAIAGFHIHRGILALGRRRPRETADTLLAGLPTGDALVVVLMGLANHDNVGAIFRNAAAFGVDAVLLDSTSCDPLYRKATRVSVGATLKVPFASGESTGSLLDTLDRHGFTPVALSPRGAQDIRTMERPRRAALFLGTEGEGLPHALMEKMRTARIDMASGFDSLNVATAAAIALHELWEQR
jgi:tRNA G18 (ribose-2'-O)-methylase SpoU